MSNKLSWIRVADKIAFVAGGTPGPFWIPVPGFDIQLCILAIGYGLPPGRENLLENWLRKDLFGRDRWNAIHSGAQGFGGTEGIYGTRGVHRNGLGMSHGKK